MSSIDMKKYAEARARIFGEDDGKQAARAKRAGRGRKPRGSSRSPTRNGTGKAKGKAGRGGQRSPLVDEDPVAAPVVLMSLDEVPYDRNSYNVSGPQAEAPAREPSAERQASEAKRKRATRRGRRGGRKPGRAVEIGHGHSQAAAKGAEGAPMRILQRHGGTTPKTKLATGEAPAGKTAAAPTAGPRGPAVPRGPGLSGADFLRAQAHAGAPSTRSPEPQAQIASNSSAKTAAKTVAATAASTAAASAASTAPSSTARPTTTASPRAAEAPPAAIPLGDPMFDIGGELEQLDLGLELGSALPDPPTAPSPADMPAPHPAWALDFDLSVEPPLQDGESRRPPHAPAMPRSSLMPISRTPPPGLGAPEPRLGLGLPGLGGGFGSQSRSFPDLLAAFPEAQDDAFDGAPAADHATHDRFENTFPAFGYDQGLGSAEGQQTIEESCLGSLLDGVVGEEDRTGSASSYSLFAGSLLDLGPSGAGGTSGPSQLRQDSNPSRGLPQDFGCDDLPAFFRSDGGLEAGGRYGLG